MHRGAVDNLSCNIVVFVNSCDNKIEKDFYIRSSINN